MARIRSGMVTLVVLIAGFGQGCVGPADNVDEARPSAERRQFPLSELPTDEIRINDQTFRVWLATTSAEQQEGLMWVPASEIADDQGMLFVFPREELRFFWMRNTITSLDIAYARMDGEIVKIHTMPPLTLQNFPSIEPAMFALEAKAGTFERLNIRAGDRIAIPERIFNLTR